MKKGHLQFALAVAVLAALYFALKKPPAKECVSSTFTVPNPETAQAGVAY